MKLQVLYLIVTLAVTWCFNVNEGDHLPRGYIVDTIPTLGSAWYVSFEVKPFAVVTGWSNIVHLSAGDEDNSRYGNRIPGVWFISDSTKPYICSAVSGNKDQCLRSTTSLPMGSYSKIDVRQVQLPTCDFQYTITINGKVEYQVINTAPRNFADVKVYRSNPWYVPASAQVRNLVYGNLPHDFKLLRNQVYQNFPIYFNEYDVSFEVKPSGSKVSSWTSILHVTKGDNIAEYGDRIPAIWFRPGTFRLHMCSAVNNKKNYCINGRSDLPTDRFTKVRITQKWSPVTSKYTYKIFIDGKQEHSVVNNNPITLKNVKVYAADQWYTQANALVKNIDVKTSQGGGSSPVKNSIFSTIPHVGHQWYVSFDLQPIGNIIKTWSSIIHLTLGGNIARYGDRVPGVWFRPNSRRLHICAPVNGNKNHCYNSMVIPTGKFTNVRIRQNLDVSTNSYKYVISIDGVDKHTVVNTQVQEFDDVIFYASDPWHPAANVLVKNLVFQNLPNGYTYGTCRTAKAPVINCTGFADIKSFRTVDGSCNNLQHPTWGASNIPLRRFIPAEYAKDGKFDTPRGFPGTNPILPPPNAVSQELFEVERSNTGSDKHVTTIFMTFGQFLDHDVTETPHTSCKQTTCGTPKAWQYPCFPLLFNNTNTCSINGRSDAICSNAAYIRPRQQQNHLSGLIDGSQIYSNNHQLFANLRSFTDGRMNVTKDNLLPVANANGINGCFTKGGCSLVGDFRGDENIALHSMHTLWVREHNRIARRLKTLNANWNDERLFQTARKINSAIWQHVTYKEYLPLLATISPYTGYKPNVDPSLSNVFSTAAFRYGHSLVPNEFTQLDNNFDKEYEPVVLQESFFNRQFINDRGIEPTMRGLVGNMSNNVDDKFAFSIARRLFVGVGSSGYLDLTALNIQRGRDHGLPPYNKFRKACGLRVVKTWSDLDIIMIGDAGKRLRKIYASPDDIDIFAGGISEKHIGKLEIGPTFNCILSKEFTDLRDGDRFYYENNGVFTPAQLNAIKKVTMATVLCNNLKGLVSVQPDAFHTPDPTNVRKTCQSIPKLDLQPWDESNTIVATVVPSINGVREVDGVEDQLDKDLDNTLPIHKSSKKDSKSKKEDLKLVKKDSKKFMERLENIVFNNVKRRLENEDVFHDSDWDVNPEESNDIPSKEYTVADEDEDDSVSN